MSEVRVRRNGQEYYPRSLAGIEDVLFYQAAQKKQKHVLLAGPPGSGKSAGLEAAFDSVPEGDKFDPSTPPGMYTIIGDSSTRADDFVGGYVQNPDSGVFEWVHGPLVRSILDDVPLLVDEIALIDTRVLSLLYPLMDGRGVLEVTQNPSLPPFYVKKNWIVVAAYNPDVPGAYMSEALLDRFSYRIEVDTDWNIALQMGVPRGVVTAMEQLNLQRKQGNITWSPQLRSLIAFKDDMDTFGLDFAVRNLVSKTPNDDRPAVIQALSQVKMINSNSLTALKLGGRYVQASGSGDDFS